MPSRPTTLKYRDTLLTGWGRTAPTRARLFQPRDVQQLQAVVACRNQRGLIARGLGRSYGDPAQNAGGHVIDMTALDGVHAVDLEAGIVEVDAGISLHRLMQLLVPLGLFVPVTPGTRYVTVGGAIASDIHGKNHHYDGTFGRHVLAMSILTTSGQIVEATSETNTDLYQATCGGMGLTGFILTARLKMLKVETSAMLVDTRRVANLDELMALMVDEDERYRYSVAWVDTLARGAKLGRGVLYRGNHATAADLDGKRRAERLQAPRGTSISVPDLLPSGLVSGLTTALFNEVWFRRHPADERDRPLQLSAFFHQLDMLENWNRVYGAAGFVQHQCVLPDGEEATLRWLLERLSERRVPASLVVLKRMGPARGLLSFPLQGWTLAVDIPANWDGLGQLLDEIDQRIVDAGGRLYLAKDSRMRPELLPEMYPELGRWREIADRYDPERRLVSDLARRLRLRGPESEG